MNTKHIIEKWLLNIKKYLFLYKDGFYELPFISNTPQLMLESMRGMPFVKFYPKKNYYSSNTPFLNAKCHYHELEKDLWIIMTELEFKKNVSFKVLYDNSLDKKYHFLTLYFNKGTKSFKLPKINIDIENNDRSWTLFKAGSKAINAHFKGQKSIFLSIYFTEEWMMNNIAQSGELKSETLKKFFRSDENCLYLPNLLEHKRKVYEPIIESILNKNDDGIADFLLLKSRTLELLSNYVNELDNQKVIKSYFEIPDADKRKLYRVENILKESICNKFPTISFLSKEIGMSETKLKVNFKKMFGVTLFQYFLTQQMKYAKDMLEHSSVSVKEVALTLGYSNPSKFSASFNKIIGNLPSTYLKK